MEKVDLSVNKYLLYDSWGYTIHITQGYMVTRVKFHVQELYVTWGYNWSAGLLGTWNQDNLKWTYQIILIRCLPVMSLSSRQGKQLVIARLCEFMSHCPENKLINRQFRVYPDSATFYLINWLNFFHPSNMFVTV